MRAWRYHQCILIISLQSPAPRENIQRITGQYVRHVHQENTRRLSLMSAPNVRATTSKHFDHARAELIRRNFHLCISPQRLRRLQHQRDYFRSERMPPLCRWILVEGNECKLFNMVSEIYVRARDTINVTLINCLQSPAPRENIPVLLR